RVRILVDNGSQTCILNKSTCEKLQLTTTALYKPQPTCLADGGHYADCTRQCDVPLRLANGLALNVRCLVLPTAEDVILRNNWLKQHDVVIHCRRDELSLQACGKRWAI
ncbi:hypothetical protein GQ54DRAFT_264684, partial [Martensiomyces pterosporus]